MSERAQVSNVHIESRLENDESRLLAPPASIQPPAEVCFATNYRTCNVLKTKGKKFRWELLQLGLESAEF